MTLLGFLLATLAVWRLTHLLAAEDGPFDLVARLRRRIRSGIVSGLLDCFYCLSLWTAVPFALLIEGSWRQLLIVWPALSAAAIAWNAAIERLSAPAQFWEDVAPPADGLHMEENDELLRKSKSRIRLDAVAAESRGADSNTPRR